ncbi:Macrophage migration inhibitory factor (MIF) [Moraxella cuniculi DSM 21768]|uniref:Macrophage migration inhibitory factor (MIF) n=1 Tax=Moraxella cuniculi DSM 21768 TaxID=1122245 RepID=A0A1N7D961_9GAMM|nr:phenylpyruvate tautomerase MIF-related protein [Moraxella cuniculi]OOS07916.1 hypothetical protein B0189_00765 [Moraxella cuniculi]SIR72393.1 Macrophage migration inhibitory factor (MIF) [Moraxella cuniculi DSM 21768]
MPFMTLKTNLSLNSTQATALKTALGKAIELIPYKSEANLLLELQDQCRFYLAGENQHPVAYVKISLFANEQHWGYPELTVAITEALADILQIAPHRIYLHFEDIGAWGVAGQYLER